MLAVKPEGKLHLATTQTLVAFAGALCGSQTPHYFHNDFLIDILPALKDGDSYGVQAYA